MNHEQIALVSVEELRGLRFFSEEFLFRRFWVAFWTLRVGGPGRDSSDHTQLTHAQLQAFLELGELLLEDLVLLHLCFDFNCKLEAGGGSLLQLELQLLHLLLKHISKASFFRSFMASSVSCCRASLSACSLSVGSRSSAPC